MYDPYADFQKFVLPNGLTVYAAHWPGREWQSIVCTVHCGSLQDPVEKPGVGHFVEHLVSRNGPMPYAELKRFLSFHGASFELGMINAHRTQYKFFVPIVDGFLSKLLPILGTMLFEEQLSSFIEEQREVIGQELRERSPMSMMFQKRFRKVLGVGTVYESIEDTVGTAESLQAITQHDVQSFYDRYYTPANMTVFSLGGCPIDTLLNHLSSCAFGTHKIGERVPPQEPLGSFPALSEHVWEFSSKDFGQIQNECVYQRYTRVPRQFGRHPVELFLQMLNPMLFQQIRESRGWTYNVSAGQDNQFRSCYVLHLGSPSLKESVRDQVSGVLDLCLQSVKNNTAELEHHRQVARARELLSDTTGRAILAAVVSDVMNKGRVVTAAEELDLLQQVTINDINALVDLCDPENSWTVIIRP